jgi:hypothetical protein
MERGLSPFRHHYGSEGALGQNGTGILRNFFVSADAEKRVWEYPKKEGSGHFPTSEIAPPPAGGEVRFYGTGYPVPMLANS